MKYDPSFHINSVTNMHCDCCGKEIHIRSLIAICPMCDAVFCETCIQNSCLENHQCEPASLDGLLSKGELSYGLF